MENKCKDSKKRLDSYARDVNKYKNNIQDFIARTKESPDIQENIQITKELDSATKWQRSDKGKECLRRGWKLRNERMKLACQGLCEQEIREIKRFYKNRPEGYHVDHIIPISRGGMHRMCNLQYVPIMVNRVKFNFTCDELDMQ